jgi:hypothetical protein
MHTTASPHSAVTGDVKIPTVERDEGPVEEDVVVAAGERQ